MLLVPILYLVWFSYNKMEQLKRKICLACQSLCPTTVHVTYLFEDYKNMSIKLVAFSKDHAEQWKKQVFLFTYDNFNKCE